MESTKITLLWPVVVEEIFWQAVVLKIPTIVRIIKFKWNRKSWLYSPQIKSYSHLIPTSRNALTFVYLALKHIKLSWVCRTDTRIGESWTKKNLIQSSKNWVRFHRSLVSGTGKRDGPETLPLLQKWQEVLKDV